MAVNLDARWVAPAVGAAALASLALQQSPLNEGARAAAGFAVLDRTANPFMVGLVVAAVTVVIDGTTSVLIALGLHTRTGVVRRLADWARERMPERRTAPTRMGTLLTDAALSLGVGAGLVVARRHLRHPDSTLGGDLGVAMVATLFIAGVAGLVGFLAGGGLVHADAVGLGGPARWIVQYGADWRVWVLVLLVVVVLTAVAPRLTRDHDLTDAEAEV